jgi:hypothetical protein
MKNLLKKLDRIVVIVLTLAVLAMAGMFLVMLAIFTATSG